MLLGYRAGVSIWNLTPFELGVAVEAKAAEGLENVKLSISQAWYTAKLSKATKIPSLESLIKKLGPQVKKDGNELKRRMLAYNKREALKNG